MDPKPRILINLAPSKFEDDWRRAAKAIDRALELTMLVGSDGFGVFAKKWLPGFGLIPILGALGAEIEDRGLGEAARADLRRWYWCNVVLERYSSAQESKSRKDYLEFTRYWTDDGPKPEVFTLAQTIIGSPGFRIHDSASYASARYSGVFCLLAIKHARDWRRGEDIRLQDLQDHHIFPRAFLKRHAIEKKIDVNTVVNRTLISDETNAKIKDKAPADYLLDPAVFPDGPQPDLLSPHFVTEASLELLREATESASHAALREIYERFTAARQSMILDEIRQACGIAPQKQDLFPVEEEDEPARDVREGLIVQDDAETGLLSDAA